MSGMKNLLRRIERLEKRLVSEPILLRMPDGRTEKILGDADYVLDLMACTLNGETVPEIELIARSIGSDEPSGAHMVDVARLLYHATKRQIQPGEDDPAN
jgi:hypothetical protein